MKLFNDKETRHGYVDGFLDSFLGMQIRVLRESRNWTQSQLGEKADMKQARISLLESMNYSDWSLDVLRRLAKAFDLRLVVKFEDFGSFIKEYLEDFDREHLKRRSFEQDVVFSKKQRNAARKSISPTAASESKKGITSGTTVDLTFLSGKAIVPDFPHISTQGDASTTENILSENDVKNTFNTRLTMVPGIGA